MTERNVFRVSMRVVGVLLLSFGVAGAFASGLTAAGLQSSRYYSALDRAAAGLVYLVIGLALLLTANALTNLLYGRDENSN
jgi:hypothetical protein